MPILIHVMPNAQSQYPLLVMPMQIPTPTSPSLHLRRATVPDLTPRPDPSCLGQLCWALLVLGARSLALRSLVPASQQMQSIQTLPQTAIQGCEHPPERHLAEPLVRKGASATCLRRYLGEPCAPVAASGKGSPPRSTSEREERSEDGGRETFCQCESLRGHRQATKRTTATKASTWQMGVYRVAASEARQRARKERNARCPGCVWTGPHPVRAGIRGRAPSLGVSARGETVRFQDSSRLFARGVLMLTASAQRDYVWCVHPVSQDNILRKREKRGRKASESALVRRFSKNFSLAL